MTKFNPNRTGYNGYSSSSDFLQMDWNGFFEYSIGLLARSFIAGSFEKTARIVISQAIAWGMYNDQGR